ncbi:hypothetical protein NX784_21885 [Massilia pinisoli]|uniref:Uncharacterized protein n=1 Tax=Massilia pinisoli TaxID=1772194 RepID=A0ABT1ZWC9_9BURK|nr:hypothetical protein [Massilia pinisoli]MCS0584248.1 hypothetical protein [Massilia pinisoli]
MIGHQHRDAMARGMALQDGAVERIAVVADQDACRVQACTGLRCRRHVRRLGEVRAHGQRHRQAAGHEQRAAGAGVDMALFARVQVLFRVDARRSVRMQDERRDVRLAALARAQRQADDSRHARLPRVCAQRREQGGVRRLREGVREIQFVARQRQLREHEALHAETVGDAHEGKVAADVFGEVSREHTALRGGERRYGHGRAVK